MDNLLLEQIDNSGLIKQGKVNQDAISRLTATDIIDFAQQSVDLTNAEDLTREKELFTHSASLSLGGGRWPCANFECRRRKVEEISQFDAFYSDRVYIHNFLGDSLLHYEKAGYIDECELKVHFENDLAVLNTLRPLIEAEIIVPITIPYYCPHCFAKHVLKQTDQQRVKKGIKHLANRFCKETTFSLKLDGRYYILKMRGPEDLIEHGRRMSTRTNPPLFLDKHPKIRGQIESGKEVHLSAKIIKEIQYDMEMANIIFNNVYFELIASQCLNTKYVTERAIDLELITNIFR